MADNKYKEEANKEEDELKSKARAISIREGSAYSVSDGFGLRNIIPYALALGASPFHIGFLSSLPSLLGNLSQLYSLKLLKRFTRKKIAFFGALLQALMWLFVIGIGILYFFFGINSNITPVFLIFIYTLLILFGAFYGPAWNSWMKDIIPKNPGAYFGKRSRLCGFIALVSMLIAGFTLDYFKQTKLFIGFILIFGVAFVFRMISSLLFLKKYEPEIKYEEAYYFNFLQFIKSMSKNNFGKFVIFVSLMTFATAISSPFFAVYMLRDLQFSYVIFTIMVVTSSLISLLLMPLWGRFGDKYGNIKLIRICGFLISFIPLLWLVIPLFLKHSSFLVIPYLILVHIFIGFSWSGFELSSLNFIYDAVTRQRMALCIAYFNILNGVGVFFGAVLGGFISSMSFSFFGLTSLLFVFLLSGVLRIAIFSVSMQNIKEVKEVKKFSLRDMEEKIFTSMRVNILRNLHPHLKPPKP